MYCKRGLSNIHATDLPQLIKAGIKGIRSKVGPGRAVKRGHGKERPLAVWHLASFPAGERELGEGV